MTSRDLLLLKLRLLSAGARLSQSAQTSLQSAKPGIRTRSGVSGGLDLVLPEHVHVNVVVDDAASRKSPFILDFVSDQYFLRSAPGTEMPVHVYPKPAFYDADTSDGTACVTVGQMCSGDRLCIGMTRHCVFWKSEDRCEYCSIGSNAPREATRKTLRRIRDTVELAAHDLVLPARHVLVGGGTPNQDDRGAVLASEITREIKSCSNLGVYVMIAPPRDLGDLDRVRDAGADELGMNIEFFTEAALQSYAPGKHRHIGHHHHYRALERAVDLFGSINTRSIAIVGLEPPEETIAGAKRLASMGVMPILSPFRPLPGSRMQDAVSFSEEAVADVYDAVADALTGLGMVPGPTCIPCQNNTVTMPTGPGVRYYAGAPPVMQQRESCAK